MSDLTIYLAGAQRFDPDATWREEITKKLVTVAEWANKTVDVFNPTAKYDWSEKHDQRQVKGYFMNRLSKADIMIVSLTHSDTSPGTAMEVQFAVDHNIPVIGFGKRDSAYPWIIDVDCQAVYEDMTGVIDCIRDYWLT